MSLRNTIFQQLSQLNDNTPLPLHLQAGVAICVVECAIGRTRKIERDLYYSLRQKHIRQQRKDETHTFRHERATQHALLEEHRARFEDGVERVSKYLRENGRGDGRVSIQDKEGREYKTRSVDALADYLDTLPAQVREARRRITKRKRLS